MFGGLIAVPSLGQDRDEIPDSLVITADEARPAGTGCSVWRRYEATLGQHATASDSAKFENALQRLTDQIDTDGTYDLTRFSFVPADSGVAFTRSVSALAALPGAAAARSRGAAYVSIQTSADGSHHLQYLDVKKDGIYMHGRVDMARFKRTYEPEVYTPPLRGLALPVQEGASWTHGERRFRVVGAGELVTPQETTPTVIRRVRIPIGEDSIDMYTFFDATSTVPEEFRVLGQMRVVPSGAWVGYYDRTETTTAQAPKGYTTHCAYLAGVPVSFPVPEDWTVMNLHGKSPSASSVSVARDPVAIDSLRPGGTEISTGARMRLGTPKNVIVSVVVYGREDHPGEYLKTLRLGSLNDTEVIQPVSRREVGGRTASQKRWRGMGAQDRPLVSTHIAFRAADLLFEVVVHRPPKTPGNADEVVQVLLDHLTVGE